MDEIELKQKRDRISDGIKGLIGDCLISIGCGIGSCPKAENMALEAQETCHDKILEFLSSEGVMIAEEDAVSFMPRWDDIDGCEEQWMKYNIICSHDDDYFCNHRQEYLINKLNDFKKTYSLVEE